MKCVLKCWPSGVWGGGGGVGVSTFTLSLTLRRVRKNMGTHCIFWMEGRIKMVIKFCDDGEYDGVERRTKSQRCHPPLLELRGQTKHHCALVIHCYDRPNRARARENIVKYTLYMEGRKKWWWNSVTMVNMMMLSQRWYPPLLVNEGTPQTSLCCNCYFSNCYFGNSAVTIAPR